MKELLEIQAELKAPKNQFNSFGKYKYRSCEDIIEAVKPLLKKQGCLMTISDSLESVAGRVYIKATVTITKGPDSITVSALARESEVKKGMDDSQITGTASSYARKYALNGLFLIDDTKDADTMDNSIAPQETAQAVKIDTERLKKIKSFYVKRGDNVKTDFIDSILSGKNVKHINRVYDGYAVDSAKSTFQEDDKKELMEDIAMENKELF